MKRFLLFLIIGVLCAVAISFALRFGQRTSNAAVAALLPRDTIAFAHVPDFNRTRDQWHHSDIYQLYAEPTVQEFLRQPLARLRERDSFSQTTQEIEQLDPKDAFVALTSMVNDKPKIVAGFRFRDKDAVEKVIGPWLSTFSKREKLEHGQHKIDYRSDPNVDIISGEMFSLATVFDQDWFFVSNDVDEIKAVLDRADGRVQDRQSFLASPTKRFARP